MFLVSSKGFCSGMAGGGGPETRRANTWQQRLGEVDWRSECSLAFRCRRVRRVVLLVVPHHVEDRGGSERAAHEVGGGGAHQQRQLERHLAGEFERDDAGGRRASDCGGERCRAADGKVAGLRAVQHARLLEQLAESPAQRRACDKRGQEGAGGYLERDTQRQERAEAREPEEQQPRHRLRRQGRAASVRV